jgi:SulP family sulfate permease
MRFFADFSMFNLTTYKREWFSDIRADVLSGIVVALATLHHADAK